MDRIGSILVALNREPHAPQGLAKAIRLARVCGARLDLFLCDAERALALAHQYDARAAEPARRACLAEGLRYLEDLWHTHGVSDVSVSLGAACESPLYEGIVHRVRTTQPGLVVRPLNARGRGLEEGSPAGGGRALDASDWELVRTCPVPLLLARARVWGATPALAAAVDLSGEEPIDLTHDVLRTGHFIATRVKGTLEAVYGGRLDAAGPDSQSWGERLSRRVEAAQVSASRMHVILGDPTTVVPQFVQEQHYDIVVLGALTHRKTLTALVGTLTGRLLDGLDCDLLLVKPAAYQCPVV